MKKHPITRFVAIGMVLASVIFLNTVMARGGDSGGSNDYRGRELLGVQVKTSEGGSRFSRVPTRYHGQFRNVCLYVGWLGGVSGGVITGRAANRFRKQFKALKEAGVDSISVCFTPVLNSELCEEIHYKIENNTDGWGEWLDKWACKNPKVCEDPKVDYKEKWNCWSKELFSYDENTGVFKQLVPKEEAYKHPFYQRAIHMVLPEYKEYINAFAREFGEDIDYWEPMDEPGHGLNVGGSKYGTAEYQPGYRFSGWPTTMTAPDGTVVEDDYLKVQKAFYEAVTEAYEDRKYDWDNKKPYILTSSLMGSFNSDGSSSIDRSDFYMNHMETNEDVAIEVESDKQVVCERPMYFNYHDKWSGGHVVPGDVTPADDWYFAEGCTKEGFDEYICIQNPNDSRAKIRIWLNHGGEKPYVRQHWIEAESRMTLNVNDLVPNKDVCGKVETMSEGTPVICERPMYFNYNGWTGGHTVQGCTEPSTKWFFAEGNTQPGFHEYICMYNPNSEQTAEVTTNLYYGGEIKTNSYSIPPESRVTVPVSNIEGIPVGADVAARLVSSNGVPIVCERSMYFNFKGAYRGGHSTPGAIETKDKWFLAEGTCRPGFEPYICIFKPGASSAEVEITYMLGDGTTRVQELTVPGNSRKTVVVKDILGEKDDTAHDFSAIVKTKYGKKIVAERPMYFNLVRSGWPANVYNGGSICMGSSPTKKSYFAEGHVSTTMEEFVTVMNPGEDSASVTLNMMLGTGEKISRRFTVAPKSRKTFFINSMGIVGLFKYCDAVAMHLFGSYKDTQNEHGNNVPGWATVYSRLRTDMDQHYLSSHELVVSSCGWPHGDPPEERFYHPVEPTGSDHTYADQASAIGDVGIGGLFGAGCKKVWIYKDIDEWHAWDNYYGLFSYTTHEPFKDRGIEPTDAWGEYLKHQERLPD